MNIKIHQVVSDNCVCAKLDGARMFLTRGKVRKAMRCCVTEEAILKGDEAWRPVTNTWRRSRRVSSAGMKILLKEFLSEQEKEQVQNG